MTTFLELTHRAAEACEHYAWMVYAALLIPIAATVVYAFVARKGPNAE